MCVAHQKQTIYILPYSQHEQEKRNLVREERELREAQRRLAMRQDEKRQCKNSKIYRSHDLNYHFHFCKANCVYVSLPTM